MNKHYFPRIAMMVMIGVIAVSLNAERHTTTLNEGWQFTKGVPSADTQWQNVRIPHDWAIYGPFDRNNDLQIVAVEQNGETEKTEKEAARQWVSEHRELVDSWIPVQSQ